MGRFLDAAGSGTARAGSARLSAAVGRQTCKSPWKVAAEFDVDRGHALSNRGQQVASPCLVGRGPAEAGAQGWSR